MVCQAESSGLIATTSSKQEMYPVDIRGLSFQHRISDSCILPPGNFSMSRTEAEKRKHVYDNKREPCEMWL